MISAILWMIGLTFHSASLCFDGRGSNGNTAFDYHKEDAALMKPFMEKACFQAKILAPVALFK